MCCVCDCVCVCVCSVCGWSVVCAGSVYVHVSMPTFPSCVCVCVFCAPYSPTGVHVCVIVRVTLCR